MKNLLIATALAATAVSGAAQAKKKMIPLTEASAAALSGKTMAVTRHERAPFTAMTAGKAMFGLLGAGAMIAAGNKLVEENDIEDPADIIARELPAALAAKYGMTIRTASPVLLDVHKPKQVAASQLAGNADLILDIRSTGWMSGYYPTDWNTYHVSYSVDVNLMDAKGTLIASAGCLAGTYKHPNSPSQAALQGYGAQLLKDVTQAHGWTCLQLLGKDQFLLPEGTLAATPAQYVDPLKLYAETHSAFPQDTTAAGAAAPAATDTAAAPVAATDTTGATVATDVAAAPAATTEPAPMTEAAPAAEAVEAVETVEPAEAAEEAEAQAETEAQ